MISWCDPCFAGFVLGFESVDEFGSDDFQSVSLRNRSQVPGYHLDVSEIGSFLGFRIVYR